MPRARVAARPAAARAFAAGSRSSRCLIGSAEFERRVAAGESTERIADAARDGGMRSLWKSGLAHVAAGRTTVDEVLRVDSGRRATCEPASRSARRSRAGRPSLRDDLDSWRAARRRRSFHGMAEVRVGTVDVLVIRPLIGGWRVLALQRGADTRCPGAWETVHGHIEAGEEPEDAAVREVREETGLAVEPAVQRPRAAVLSAQAAHRASGNRVRRLRRRAGERRDRTRSIRRAEWLSRRRGAGALQLPRRTRVAPHRCRAPGRPATPGRSTTSCASSKTQAVVQAWRP